jgi:hypothetical protein
MAAYSLITELQSSDSLARTKKSQILELALKYQLPSKFTSFVATTSNDTASSDTLKFHQITLSKPPPPIQQPGKQSYEDKYLEDCLFSLDVQEPEQDWEGNVDQYEGGDVDQYEGGDVDQYEGGDVDEDEEDEGLTFDLFDGGPPARSSKPSYGIPPASSSKPSYVASPSLPPVFKDLKTVVVSTQYFDGCWDSAGIHRILESAAHSALSQAGHSDAKIWATALAIAILELKCQDTKTTWEIVAQKGRTYILKILFGIEKKDKDEILQMVSDLIEKAKKSPFYNNLK